VSTIEQMARELLGTVRPPIKVHRDSYTDFLWLYPAPYEYPPDGMYLYRADDVERLLAAALREQPEARGVVDVTDEVVERIIARAERLAEALREAFKAMQRSYHSDIRIMFHELGSVMDVSTELGIKLCAPPPADITTNAAQPGETM